MNDKLIRFFHDPQYRFYALSRIGATNFLSDKAFLRIKYRTIFGKELDFSVPQTYSEKLQWLKLYDRKPEYCRMVDKYEAKEYVASLIGTQYIVPTLGVWEKFDDIDFNRLPNQFVLKCTHDSGGIVICTDKNSMDWAQAKRKIEKCLKQNYYWQNREWPYKHVKPRIIAEQYMVDESGYELKDYKFFCFDGKPELLFIACDRTVENEETKFNFYDMSFKFLPFTNGHPNAPEGRISKPQSFDEMKRLAGILSKGHPQLRVDFYEINGQIFFGELTFYHWSGLKPFDPPIWDKKLGELIKLPMKNRE